MTPSREEDLTNKRYLMAVAIAMLIWSTSFVATKIAYQSFPPLTLGALRFVIASFALGAAAVITKQLSVPCLRDLIILTISGILGITLYFSLENTGISMTSASDASLICASYPAITVLMERMVYGIRVSWKKWFGIILTIFGITIITWAGTQGNGAESGDRLTGNILLAATGIVWALYNFGTRAVINKYPAITVSFYQTVAGTLAFIPLAFFETSQWQEPTALSIGVLIYLGIFCSVAAFMLYNYGLRKLNAGTAVFMANLIPVFGVFFSWAALHEQITLLQLAGGAVVIAGVFYGLRH